MNNKYLQNDFHKNFIDPVTNNKKLMRTNRLLSNKYTLIVVCSIFSIAILLICNYVFNCLLALPSVIKDLEHPLNYVGSNNLFIFNFRKFWLFYLIIFLFIVYVNIRFLWLMRTSYHDYNVGQKGVARWTTLDEIKAQYKAIPEKTQTYAGNGGIPVARYKNTIFIDDSPVNNLIIGITRSGKGEMFVFPTIDIYSRAEIKPSIIATDPKLELAAASYDTLKKRGYDVYILNLIDPLKSMGFNPLQLIIDAYKNKEHSQAELLCSSFCYSIFNPDEGEGDSQFWANNSTYLLSALILAHISDCIKEDESVNATGIYEHKKKQQAYLSLPEDAQSELKTILNIKKLKEQKKSIQDAALSLNISLDTVKNYWDVETPENYILPEDEYVQTNEYEKKITMYSIINTFSTLARIKIDEFTTALDIYFNERPDLDRAKLLYSAIEVAGTKTKGSIFSNTLSKLNIFTYEEIAKMTAESSIDLKSIGFGDRPIAIFLGIPDYDRSNHFIASVFIRQLYFVLAKHATKSLGGKCKREVVFMLDEFGNLPAIESMANIITVCLGRNIRFNLIVQAYSQVEKLYGKDADTIIGNCGNQLYILTNDKETAEHFSSLIGSETITNINRNGNKLSLNKSFTEMYDEKPLLNSNELMELLEGECVLKRVVKRTDLAHKDIKPTPIFNKESTKFKYRYKYLLDDFPSDIVLSDLPIETTMHINVRERVFDINAYYDKKQKQSDGNFEDTNELGRKITKLTNAAVVIAALKKLNITDFDISQLTIEQTITILERKEKNAEITCKEKETILFLLTI